MSHVSVTVFRLYRLVLIPHLCVTTFRPYRLYRLVLIRHLCVTTFRPMTDAAETDFSVPYSGMYVIPSSIVF